MIATFAVLLGILILLLLFREQKQSDSQFSRIDTVEKLEAQNFADIVKILNGRTVGMPPDESPVTVRGGSFEILTSMQWQNQSTGIYDVAASTTSVTLDGVSLTDGGAPKTEYATSLQKNWSMVFTFRDKKDHEDTTYKLSLCTLSDCSASGSSLSQTLYLEDVDHPGNFDLTLNDPKQYTDKVYRIRYDVPGCFLGSSRCKHIKKITVSGITFTSGDSGPFYCRAGACDVGIDK